MPSFKTPTSEQVQAALPLISSPQHELYFFSRLNNPLWIKPLKAAGAFSSPPKPEKQTDGKLLYFNWPQSKYLARMAKLAPEDVVEILETIDTDNLAVVTDIVGAANSMPPATAARLVPRITKALRDSSFSLVYFRHAIDLCVRLAKGEQVAKALELAKVLFAPHFDEARGRPRGRDSHWYKEGLQEIAPELATAAGPKFLTMLCSWATAAVEAREHFDKSTGVDYSYIWRPAIEDHSQNRDNDFAGAVIEALRDAFEAAIRAGAIPMEDAVALLKRQKYKVFKRLVLHLLVEFGDRAPERVHQLLMDVDLFADAQVRHEYVQLLKSRWTMLTTEEQNTWMSWIDTGPEAIYSGYHDKPKDPDRTNLQKRYWQFERLHPIRDHLNGHWQAFYKEMLALHGEPEMADLPFRMGPMEHIQDESPYTAEQLAAVPFVDAVRMVATWKPDPQDGFRSRRSVEGLSSTFARFVASNVENSARNAEMLIGAPAVYVRRLIQAVDDAIKAGSTIPLGPVLSLAEWVLTRPAAEVTSPNDDSPMVDNNWQWCRDAMASLIEHVGQAKGGDGRPRYGEDMRGAIWSVVSKLADGPAVTYLSDADDEVHPSLKDWSSRMLNSTRGKAVEAVFDYADWVASLLVPGPRSDAGLEGGFDQMPEVRECLEHQLEREDEDFAGRAAFGAKVGLMYWLDRAWLKTHADDIFDLSAVDADASTSLGWAAWNTFLAYHRPHIEYYRLLKKQYDIAVQHAEALEAERSGEETPFANMAEHLVVLFARGDFGATLEDALKVDDAILARLVTKTREPVRTHALEFVGRSLSDDGALVDAVVQRFMQLWDFYWSEVGQADAADDPTSVTFGRWFSCGKFPTDWSLDRLWAFVQVVPRPEPDSSIAERLAAICNENPQLAAQILKKLVDGDVEGWRVSGWNNEAKAILRCAMAAGGQASQIARATIEVLGRRGFVEFGLLLPRPA